MAKKRTHIPNKLSRSREQELLDAARRLFFTQGIHATTMQQIAKQAKVSKTTIYRRYNSKAEMFEALIKSTSNQLIEKINTLEFNLDEPQESLRKAGKAIQKETTAPEHLNLLRQLIAEVPRNPALQKMVNKGITNFIPEKLLHFLKMLLEKGLMTHPDPVQAASTFMLICNGGYYPLLNVAGSKKDIERRLKNDVDMFICGCQIKNPQ